MTIRAAHVFKGRLAPPGGGEAIGVARNYAARNIHCHLKDRCGGDVANSQLVRDSVFVKIICRNDVSVVVFLTNAETLDRLHAVVMVVSVTVKTRTALTRPFCLRGLIT